jgi:hypothetical protein
VLFYGVVSDSTEEAVELFTSREEAEAIVQAWDRDEPEQAGALRVEQIDFRTGTANQDNLAHWHGVNRHVRIGANRVARVEASSFYVSNSLEEAR